MITILVTIERGLFTVYPFDNNLSTSNNYLSLVSPWITENKMNVPFLFLKEVEMILYRKSILERTKKIF